MGTRVEKGITAVELLELGLATEFRSEKIPRNRFGMASLIPRKKELIPRHSEVYGRVNSEARNRRKWYEKISFTKNPAPANRIDSLFLSRLASERNSESLLLFFFHGTEFRAFFSSAERFGTESESFLFRRMVQNGIPRVCLYFCSMVQNSEHSSPLWNGSERNSESFLFRGTAGIPPKQTNRSVYSVFRLKYCWRKLPTRRGW
jgi:hypothetical protein